MELSAINSTAIWTASIRAEENNKDNSIVNDPFAHMFIPKENPGLEHFQYLDNPRKSILSRYSYIDDYLKEQIKRNHKQMIVTLGAGFDCRPFRINGGIWFEIDLKPVIDTKENILPAKKCDNKLSRIIADTTSTDMTEVLKAMELKNPIFVIEGMLNYLNEPDVKRLLDIIKNAYNNAHIICDIMSAAFYEKHAMDFSNALNKIGLRYNFLESSPKFYLENSGWNIEQNFSIIELAITNKLINIPYIIRKLFLNKFIQGYQLYVISPKPRHDTNL